MSTSEKPVTQARGKWINNDSAFLCSLAQQIAEDENLRCLPNEDKQILNSLSTVQAWSQISGADTDGPIPADLTDKVAETVSSEELDALTLLFRSRSLIYENCINSDLFPTRARDLPSLVSPYVVEVRAVAAEDAAAKESAKLNANRIRPEEDDYDVDEASEDDEERTGKDTTTLEADNKQSASTTPGISIHHKRDLDSARPSTPSRNAASTKKYDSNNENRKNEDAILRFELDTIYHTLEYDKHALLEQNTLEASDRRVEEESGISEKEKLSAVNFGAANLSLKHLIAKIDKSRERLAMTDNELRVLLSEVRKNRSKWANEEKIGQEELYEAAERVVLELRGYTEHSTAFLNKVTKRDVPDYYNIIKEPMDLGTLMKNLKNLVYKSKTAFTKDVMLIWENCLKYNADVAHPIRKHALAMRKKSEQLLAMVPDVVVRDRAEVEAEEFGLMDLDQDEEEEANVPLAGKSTRGTYGPKSSKAKKSNKGNSAPTTESTLDQSNGIKVEENTRESSRSPERIPEGQKTLPVDTEDATQDIDRGGNNHLELEEIEETDTSFQIWRTRTKKLRAHYAGARQKRIKEESLRPEEVALHTTPDLLARLGDGSVTGEIGRSPSTEFGTSNRNPRTEQYEQSADLLLREYEIQTMPFPATLSDDFPPKDPPYQVRDVARFEPPATGLYEKFRATALEMKNIRRLCTKLSTLKLMQDPTMSAFPASYFRQLMETDTQLKFEPIEVSQFGVDVEPCGEELARSLLQRSSAHLLYQAGFEDFQPQALDCFTEVAADFFKVIGRVMKDYTESKQVATEEEVLRHALFEVGIADLEILEDYITEDIESRSEKVVVLHDRLKKFLNDFIQGTVDGEATDNNLFDENNRDAFLSGNFGEETGEDFFGFRELGLDKEFGLSSLSVPLRLLQGRLRPTVAGNAVVDRDGISPLRYDRRFPHITRESISRQIGIFRPFLESKMALVNEEEDNLYLVEDEDLPMRQRKPKPRLGPTGKITSAMKRALKDPHTISPKKKKKLDRDSNDVNSPTASLQV